MYKEFKIRSPFFEIGPKAYIYGNKALELAKRADEAGEKYNVQIIYTPQYVDIYQIAKATKHIFVFAQHMDSIEIGRGVGSVLPEALREAGAVGVLLNHTEKRLSLSEINKSIKRADEAGLATLVCADTPEESVAIAHLEPNIILAESPSLIGVNYGGLGDRSHVKEINSMVKAINPNIRVLHGAGIVTGRDVYDIILLGAEATGCTSGIVRAEDPYAALDEMISSLRKAWDEVNGLAKFR